MTVMMPDYYRAQQNVPVDNPNGVTQYGSYAAPVHAAASYDPGQLTYNQGQQTFSTPAVNNQMPMPTAPTYNYDSAIRNRADSISQMGTGTDQVIRQAALQKVSDQAKAVATGQQQYQPPDPNSGDLRSRIVNYASQFQNTPYKWGGNQPGGFDCSGLVQYVYNKMGVSEPRVSQQQATTGQVAPLGSLQSGDLVAWGNSPATAHHIAIYAGNGMVWEAPHTGAAVRLRAISPSEAGIMGIKLSI